MTGASRPPRSPVAPRVHLSIGEVVVRGVERGQVPTVVAAMERALLTLVRADGAGVAALTSARARVVRAPAPPPPPSSGSGPAALGARAAAAVWAAVGGVR